MVGKVATIVGDVRGLQQRHPPIKYNLSCREHQRLSTEGKIVSKYCIISKTLERGFINQPPWICVYVGGLIDISSPYVWGKLFFHCFFPDFKKIKSTKTTILPIFFSQHSPSWKGIFFHLITSARKRYRSSYGEQISKKLHVSLTSSIIQKGTMNGISIRPIQTVFFVMKV